MHIKCPNGLQDGLRSFDLAYLNSQKAKTSIFNDPTTLFEGPDRSGRATGGQVGDHFGCMEAKLHLECGLEGQVAPRGAKLRLECGLERSSAAQKAPSCAWSAAWRASWRSIPPRNFGGSEAPGANFV